MYFFIKHVEMLVSGFSLLELVIHHILWMYQYNYHQELYPYLHMRLQQYIKHTNSWY